MKKEKSRRRFLKNLGIGSLGIMLLNNLEAKANTTCNQTTLDYFGEGPFYTANPPSMQNGQLASPTEPGTRLVISGHIFNLDCSQIVPNTIVDVWHADNNGAYDNSGYNLRGQVLSNSQGFYSFETIKPGLYLNGSTYRPSHIHVKITPPGFPTITTQIYFSGDQYIASDAAASINSGTFDATHRIINLSTNNQGTLEGTWDIVVDGNGTLINTNDLHLENGMIYNASPNPFNDEIRINYGVFKEGLAEISVYDLSGKKLANLVEAHKVSNKYEVIWKLDKAMSSGYYLITLKLNNLQVHHLKVYKL